MEWFSRPFIKWILKKGNGDASLLLKMMEGEKNRKASARLGIGYHDGKQIKVFIGETKGTITDNIRGENGFGWDPVFIPQKCSKTYAEMTFEERSKTSHRRKGLEEFKKFLNTQK